MNHVNKKQTELYITRIERFMERLTRAVLSENESCAQLLGARRAYLDGPAGREPRLI